MPLPLPEALHVGSAGNYIVSIRLQPDGLSFSACLPESPASFFLRKIPFEPGKPYLTAFKESFFNNSFLAWDYRELHILPPHSPYTLVPRPFFDETQKEQLMTFFFSDPHPCFLSNTACEGEVVFLFHISPDLYAFCSRSFTSPRFIHPLTPLLSCFRQQSRTAAATRMYAVYQDNSLHLFCFRAHRILLVNTFTVLLPDHLLHHLLDTWAQLGFDQEKDDLFLSVDTLDYNALSLALSSYLRHIHPVELPSGSDLLYLSCVS